jgi:hypothetical protein
MTPNTNLSKEAFLKTKYRTTNEMGITSTTRHRKQIKSLILQSNDKRLKQSLLQYTSTCFHQREIKKKHSICGKEKKKI